MEYRAQQPGTTTDAETQEGPAQSLLAFANDAYSFAMALTAARPLPDRLIRSGDVP
jgi:hypothetical protein